MNPIDECPACQDLGLCRSHEEALQAEADYYEAQAMEATHNRDLDYEAEKQRQNHLGPHRQQSHYEWLETHLWDFLRKAGVDPQYQRGIIVAHGDKCRQYEREWAEAGVPFFHGAAIYLLSYCWPYSQHVRETQFGWVAPKDWVIKSYENFRPWLAEIE